MSISIFINYRREDTLATAGRLHDRLAREFGRDDIFMDVDHIPAGVDFVTHLHDKVAACDVFLVLIGPRWLALKDDNGQRRIDNENDFVSIEIAGALDRDIRVIPVLIDGTQMPRREDLPAALASIARRNAVELRNTQFGRDAEALIDKLRDAPRRRSPLRRPHIAAAAAAVAAMLSGFGAYELVGGSSHPTLPGNTPPPSLTASNLTAALNLKSGETTLLDGWKNYDRSGFNFRTERIVGWNSLLGDILVAKTDNGRGETEFFMPGVQGGVSTDNVGDIVKAGVLEIPGRSFSEVKTCPEGKYAHGWVKARLGGVYCVRVRDGQSYAKVVVRDIGDDRIRFEWVYNPSGHPDF